MLLLLFGAGCTTQPTPDNLPLEVLATPVPQSDLPTIAQILQDDSEFLFLIGVLKNAGIFTQFDTPGSYTFFAATNTAFSKLGIPPTEIDSVAMSAILRHHTLDGVYASADLEARGTVTSEADAPIIITREGDHLFADFVPIITANLKASNGIVHVVDGFILPPETGPDVSLWQLVRTDERLTRFRTLVESVDLVYALRFQYVDAVLAPDDQAFSRASSEAQMVLNDPEQAENLVNYWLLNQNGWPQGTPILLADLETLPTVGSRLNFRFGTRNVESIRIAGTGSNLTLDGAHVVAGDLLATNGVLHIIDAAILPRPVSNTP